MGVDVGDETVVSRSHLSEKQQQIKLSFEEKERLEARRKVNEEKRQRKLVSTLLHYHNQIFYATLTYT